MRVITDQLDLLALRARKRRWRELIARFPDLGSMRVLDLGGSATSWTISPVHPAQVVAVNLDDRQRGTERVKYVVADACNLPAALRAERFDLVYSNSLIEHVGGPERQRELANMVRAMAPYHWIQTPNLYFPIEPHWRFPGFQFLPFLARVAISRTWPLGYTRSRSWSQALTDVVEVSLLSISEMRAHFPDSEIWRERFGGVTKSIVAVKSPHGRRRGGSPPRSRVS